MSENQISGRVREKSREKIRRFFAEAERCLCKTNDEVSEAFRNFSIKMVEGVSFRIDTDIRKAAMEMAQEIVEAAGADKASVPEVMDAGYSAFATVLLEEDSDADGNVSSAQKRFENELLNIIFMPFDFVGPCNIFRFDECEPDMRCDRITITRADNFLDESNIPKSGKNWALRAGDGEWPLEVSVGLDYEIRGIVWWVKTRAPKDLVSHNARWLSEIFISALRLGLRPADYCHRPRLGQVEANPFAQRISYQRHITFDAKIFHFAGVHLVHQYKIDESFLFRFREKSFQSKLNCVLDPPKGTVGERLSNALGWAARGRQSTDISERLLYFFTALEALLSEQSSFQPVADSIARFIGVILSNDSTARETTYREVKNLYHLRSGLVHRGTRNAHWLNGNNIQHIAESALHIVWKEVEFDQPHSEFLAELKSASHGAEWPKRN